MDGNFPTSTYNRKSGIVVKKQYDRFYWDRPVLIIDSIRKKNQTVRIIGPVRKIGTWE